MLIKYLLNGKEINLTGDNTIIKSTNFNVDKDGNMDCKNGTFKGKVYVGGSEEYPEFTAEDDYNKTNIYPSGVSIESKEDGSFAIIKSNDLSVSKNGVQFIFTENNGKVLFYLINNNNGVHPIAVTDNYTTLKNPDGQTLFQLQSNGAFINGDNLYVNGKSVQTNSSDEKLKKNIKDSKINAIDIIKQINHKEFDWKSNNEHENIGYIAQELEKIDKNYVVKDKVFDSKEKEVEYMYQVRLLPLLATTTKAIQEQQETIENLLKRIERLEEKNGIN